MPVNALILRSLMNLYQFYGDEFKVECPTGSGQLMTLFEVSQELVRRLTGTFLRDANGKRPVYRRGRPSSKTIPTGATSFFSTSTSMATTERASAPAIRPVGPAWWPP